MAPETYAIPVKPLLETRYRKHCAPIVVNSCQRWLPLGNSENSSLRPCCLRGVRGSRELRVNRSWYCDWAQTQKKKNDKSGYERVNNFRLCCHISKNAQVKHPQRARCLLSCFLYACSLDAEVPSEAESWRLRRSFYQFWSRNCRKSLIANLGRTIIHRVSPTEHHNVSFTA